MKHLQYKIQSKPRHIRYLFFIDETCDGTKLLELFNKNLRSWGGRYNPIIPLANELILPNWVDIIKFYDPDYIGYSKGIAPKIIEDICEVYNLNPISIFNIEDTKEYIEGVYSANLIPHIKNYFGSYNKFIQANNLWDIESNLKEYYKINYLLHDRYIIDKDILGNHSSIVVNKDNFNSTNQILFENKIYNSTLLSSLNVNTSIVRSLNTPNYFFELIITTDDYNQSDLLYHWNKKFYENYKLPIQSLLVTASQFEELIKDDYFWSLLYQYSSEFKKINLVSFSFDFEKMKELKDKLNDLNEVISFEIVANLLFPYPIFNTTVQNHWDLKEKINIVHSQSLNHLLSLPKLSFDFSKISYQSKWMVDVDITELSERNKSKYFPFNTDTKYLSQSIGRINCNNRLSILVSPENVFVELTIINFKENIRQIILTPKKINLKSSYVFGYCNFNDQSNLLRQFINLFNDDFYLIHEYLSDKLWFDIFSELSNNTKVEGDTITFTEIFTKLLHIPQINIDINKSPYRNEEKLKSGICAILQELQNLKIFIPGFIIKCKSCSSSLWYSLEETKSILQCKGCYFQNNFKVELPISYKLNHITKNTFGIRDKNGRYEPHGNLTVVRTLIHLFRNCNNFEYCPQLDIYENFEDRRPVTDLDIICLADGKLYIGEAKNNSSDFKEHKYKCLLNLLTLAKTIVPDFIIISCTKDERNQLQKARQFLEHNIKDWLKRPTVISYKTSEPDYFELSGNKYFSH